MTDLIQFLKEDKTFISHLEFDGCAIGGTPIKAIFNAIKNTVTLKEVCMKNFHLDD